MKKEPIFVAHLLNDYSGSPRVLSEMINIYFQEGHEIHLFTSSGQGHLSNVKLTSRCVYEYYWNKNRIVTFYRFLKAQTRVFFQIKNAITKSDIMVVNTLLPFGAALAAKYRRTRIIYYLHESYIRPHVLFYFLYGIAKFCATRTIFVSKHLEDALPKILKDSRVIYSALPFSFTDEIGEPVCYSENFVVLMVASLKEYKGYKTFIALADELPNITFKLVVSVPEYQIGELQAKYDHLTNLYIYPQQESLNELYRSSHLVVNLTDPLVCIESFGLTILEGMAYGMPAIAPSVGGVVELVEDGFNGYLIDPSSWEALLHKIEEISKNEKLWRRLSVNALHKYSGFDHNKMQKQYLDLIEF